MPDDIYDDIKLINTLKGSSNTFRRNPVMEDFFASAQGTQNLFANQMKMNAIGEALQERKQLKNAMSGMDMAQPDYAKLGGIAPYFTQKLMGTITDMSKEQRLTALQLAEKGNDFLTKALPVLMHNPQIRPQIAKQLSSWGFQDDFIQAVVPDPAQTTPEGFINSIGLALDATNTIKGSMTVALEREKQEGKKKEYGYKKSLQEGKYEQEQVLKDKGMAIAAMQATGKPSKYVDNEGITHEVRIGARGDIIDSPMPEGYKPYEKPTTGKGTGKTTKKPALATEAEWNLYQQAKTEAANDPEKLKNLNAAAQKRWLWDGK